MHSSKKSKWVFGLVFGMALLSIFTRFAEAKDTERKARRLQHINESLDENFLSQNGIAYFYQILDKESLTPVGENDFRNSGGAFELVRSLDYRSAYEKAVAEGQELYVLITKMAYSVPKGLDFFKTHQLDSQFWRATRPELGIDAVVTPGETAPFLSFSAHGSAWVPAFRMQLAAFTPEGFAHSEASTAIQANLSSTDQNLGKPSLITFEIDTDFKRKLGSKTSLQSVSLTKYYDRGPTQTLAVSYTLAYTYALLPGFLGGTNKMRIAGLKTLLKALNAIEAYK